MRTTCQTADTYRLCVRWTADHPRADANLVKAKPPDLGQGLVVLVVREGAIAIWRRAETVERAVDGPDAGGVELFGQPGHHRDLGVILVRGDDVVTAIVEDRTCGKHGMQRGQRIGVAALPADRGGTVALVS